LGRIDIKAQNSTSSEGKNCKNRESSWVHFAFVRILLLSSEFGKLKIGTQK
jgi:hypothetical protein